MGRTKSIENSVKYTVVLPESSLKELKELSPKRGLEKTAALLMIT